MNLAETIAQELLCPATALRFVYVRKMVIFTADQEAIVATLDQINEGLPIGFEYFCELRTLPRPPKRSKKAINDLVQVIILDRNLVNG